MRQQSVVGLLIEKKNDGNSLLIVVHCLLLHLIASKWDLERQSVALWLFLHHGTLRLRPGYVGEIIRVISDVFVECGMLVIG